MARDQAIEFYSSGCGRRLKKARERRERSLSNLKRRENRGGNFASDESISSSSSSDDSEGEGKGRGRIDPRKTGQGEPGSSRGGGDATAVSWQEGQFWSDAPSGVFASSSASSDSSDGSSDDRCRGSGKRRRRRRRCLGEDNDRKDENGGRVGEGGDACGSTDARGVLSRHHSDPEKSSAEGDEEDEREGVLAELGLRAEFLPLAMGAWEDAVCLGDDDHGSYAFRR